MVKTAELILLAAGIIGMLAVFWWLLRDKADQKQKPILAERPQAVRSQTFTTEELIAFLAPPESEKGRLVIFCGAPGSGKSRLADGMTERGYICLSLDKLWELMPHARIYPDQLQKEYFAQLQAALASGANIVDDNLNFTYESRQTLLSMARTAGYTEISLVHMDTPLDLCLKRNPERKYAVPEQKLKAIWQQFNTSGLPSPKECTLVRIQPREQELKHCEFFK